MIRSTALVIAAAALAATTFDGEARAASPAATPATATATTAAPAIAAATTVVDLASLPEGNLLDLDWTGQPQAIDAKQKIDGVKLLRQVQNYGSGNHQVFVQVSRIEPNRPPGQDDEDEEANVVSRSSGICFADASSPDERKPRPRKGRIEAQPTPESHGARAWETTSTTEQTTIVKPEGPNGGGRQRVQQLHIEQLVVTRTGAALESRDAWIDSSTGGGRVHATAHLPLRDLGPTPQGLHLFAARHGDEVVFVAQTAATSPNLFVSRNGVGVSGTNCDHLVVTMPLRRGMSQFANLNTISRMRDTKDQEGQTDGNAAGTAAKVDAVDFKSGGAQAAPPSRPRVRPTLVTRLGQVVVSEVWEPNDPAPQISFSHGWTSREHAD